MVMIPKVQKWLWRQIAMLVIPYLIWARHADEGVSRWAVQLNKEWIACGSWKSTEEATYDAALMAEE